jgi:hypothetical protein
MTLGDQTPPTPAKAGDVLAVGSLEESCRDLNTTGGHGPSEP